jgi:hypothetical protein
MIIDEIKKANMEAMKAHDNAKRTAFQIVMSKFKLAEVEKRAKGEEMADADMVAILQKSIKELDEEFETYQKAGRAESAEEIKNQKLALETFLPKMMSAEEIKNIILALDDKSIGAVMKHFKLNYAGKCDMKTVQEVLKSL